MLRTLGQHACLVQRVRLPPIRREQAGSGVYGLVWWGCTATRPYMRAIHALGLARREAGNEEEARACFDRLLEMNPHDNQGIRFLIEDAELEMAPSL